MKWLGRILFPGKDRTIRISRDHLPGLKPPKSAPFIPKPSKPKESPGTDIEGLYETFIAYGGLKPKKRSKKDRGVGF